MSDKKDTELSLRRVNSLSSGNVLNDIIRSYVAKPDATGRHNEESINISDLLNASDTVTSQSQTYDVLKQILPDIEVTESVTATGILYSKGNQKLEFVYSAGSDILGTKVTDALNGVVKSYFTGVLKLESELKDIVVNALYRVGSHPIMVLPEGTIEATLRAYNSNYSSESLPKDNAIKDLITNTISGGKTGDYAAESYFDSNYQRPESAAPSNLDNMLLTLTYNAEVLKLSTLNEVITKQRLEMESLAATKGNVSSSSKRIDKIQNKLKERKANKLVPMLDLFTMGKLADKSFGHPIRYNLPPESVIPILSPTGDTAISYLIILDNQCNPIRNSLNTDQYSEISNNLRKENAAYSQISSRLRNLGIGEQDITQISKSQDLKRFWNFYSQKFEETLRAEIEKGVSKGNVRFKADEGVYRLMFSRLLQGMQTRILCVPSDLITYIAFDKNAYGIGVSLIEKNKITGYIRANLQLAGAVGALQNSINHKSIDIELDPADGNPKRTVATLVNNVTSLDTNSIPTLMAGSPTEMLQYVGRSGYSINVTGDNKKYPLTKCSVNDKGRNVVRPDTDYMDSLRRTHISSLWSTPEAIDASLQGELATAIIINNAVNAERYNMANNILCEFMSKHIVQYINNSSILLGALTKVIEDNIKEITPKYKEYLGDESPDDIARKEDPDKVELTKNVNDILEVYLATLAVNLPKPDATATQTQADAIASLISNVDSVLDAMFSDGMTYGLGKEKMQEEIQLLKAAIKAREIQKWAKETGYLKDIFDIDLATKDPETINAIVAGLANTPNAILNIAVNLSSAILKVQKDLSADVEIVSNDKQSVGGSDDGYDSEGSAGGMDEGDDSEVPDLPDIDGGEVEGNTEPGESESSPGDEAPPELPDDTEDNEVADNTDGKEPKEPDDSSEPEGDDAEPPELPEDKK